MVTLRDKDSNQLLGKISDEELAFLVDQLEEESRDDTDYFIDAATIELLEDEGAPESLIAILRSGLGERDGFDVQWSKG